MGQGLVLNCKKCEEEVTLMFGVGFNYPEVVKELREKAFKGKFGKEWKNLMEADAYRVINGEDAFYYCSKCHHFENSKDLSIYEPKNKEELLKEKRGDKTVEELGHDPWGVMDKSEYKLVKKYQPICPHCKEEMKKKTINQVSHLKLKCPKCGDELVSDGWPMLWD